MTKEQRVGWALWFRWNKNYKWTHVDTNRTKTSLINGWCRSAYFNYKKKGRVKIVPVYATPPEDME